MTAVIPSNLSLLSVTHLTVSVRTLITWLKVVDMVVIIVLTKFMTFWLRSIASLSATKIAITAPIPIALNAVPTPLMAFPIIPNPFLDFLAASPTFSVSSPTSLVSLASSFVDFAVSSIPLARSPIFVLISASIISVAMSYFLKSCNCWYYFMQINYCTPLIYYTRSVSYL